MNTSDLGLNLMPSHPRGLQGHRGSGAHGRDEPQGAVLGLACVTRFAFTFAEGCPFTSYYNSLYKVRCEETVLVVEGCRLESAQPSLHLSSV